MAKVSNRKGKRKPTSKKKDRLATTVRADSSHDDTLVLGGTTLKADSKHSIVGKLAGRASRMAKRLMPGQRFEDPPVAVGLKKQGKLRTFAAKIARRSVKAAKPKSRVPVAIAILATAAFALGFTAYKTYPWSFGAEIDAVAKVMDTDTWFNKVAGKEKATKSNYRASRRATVVDQRASYPSAKPAASRAVVKKSSSRSNVRSKKTVRSGAKKKRVVRSHGSKKRSWKRGVAKLKRQGKKKYRRASQRYKKRGK